MAIDIFPLWHASMRHPAENTPLPEGEPGILCIKVSTPVFSWVNIYYKYVDHVVSAIQKSQIQTGLCVVNSLDRDEVHLSVR